LGLEILCGRRRVSASGLLGRGAKVLNQSQALGEVLLGGVVFTDAGGDFGEVMDAFRRDDSRSPAGFIGGF
jgi:hypothetical protein